MKQRTKTALAFISLSFCLMAHASHPPSPHCADALEGVVPVSLRFGDVEQIEATYRASVRAIHELQVRLDVDAVTPISRVPIETLLHVPFRRLRLAMELSIGFGSFQRRTKLLETFARNLSEYERMVSSGRYMFYLGSHQRYMSTLLLSYAAIVGRLDPKLKIRTVDLGAGVGDSALAIKRTFPDALVIATDRALAPLRIIQQLESEIPTLQHDFTVPLPFKTQSIDLVTSITAATQYLNRKQFFRLAREVRRVLVPGGLFLFEFAPHTSDVTGRDPRSFIESMRVHGFEPVGPLYLRFDMKSGSVYPILLRKTP